MLFRRETKPEHSHTPADNGKSDSGKVEYLDISATFGNASDDGIAVIVL